MNERIVAAACRDFAGTVWSLDPPARHHDVIRHIAEQIGWEAGNGPVVGAGDSQGFVTSTGRYVNRLEARKIAEAANQIIPRVGEDSVAFRVEHDHLFSEDMW